MLPKSKHRSLLSVAMTMLAASLGFSQFNAFGKPQPKPAPPNSEGENKGKRSKADSFRVPQGSQAKAIPEIGPNVYGYYVKLVSKNGKKYVQAVFLSDKGLNARYPDLTAGDVVRMLDGLYRVESLVKFTRLKKSSFPKGVQVADGCYGFPIGGYGGNFGEGHPWSRHPHFIIKDPTTAKNLQPQVTIGIFPRSGDLKTEHVVQKGDIVWIGQFGHRVKNIVLPDPKRKIVGWVDIEPKVAGVRCPPSFRLKKKPDRPFQGPVPGPLDFTGYWYEWHYRKPGSPGDKKKEVVYRVKLGTRTNMPGLFDRVGEHYWYGLDYPVLRVGDPVRILDGVYRLADNYGLFKRIAEKDLPKDARPAPHSYGLPFNGSMALHKSSNQVVAFRKYVRVPKHNVAAKTFLDTAIDERYRGKSESTEVLVAVPTGRVIRKKNRPIRAIYDSQWVKEGDILWFGKYGHRVKKIVLPDAKHKIAGWIDIDQVVAKTKDE